MKKLPRFAGSFLWLPSGSNPGFSLRRGVEIGSILADRDPETHENRYPALELLRLAIPRRVYTDNHIRVIAAACRNIFERRAEITTGYRITFEAPILRHFTVELDKIR